MFEVAAFFVISLLVVSALFMTVHRRDIESVEAYKARTSLDRYDLTVQRWLEGGFWRHGGMFVVPRNLALGWYPDQVPPDSQLRTDSLFVYRNGTASYIIPLFWIQGIQQALNGRTSPTATVVYNQIMVALIAVALATLALRICRHLEIPRTQGFALATCCLVSFQTFAPSVASFWEVSHVSVTLLFALVFLVYEFDRWNDAPSRRRQVTRSILATLVLFGEPATGSLFLLAYIGLRYLMSERPLKSSDVLVLFIIPACIVAAYVQGQHLLVRANQDSVFFVGTRLLSRSGLDGDITWYRDHWDLLLRGHLTKHLQQIAPLTEWTFLIFAGFITSIYVLARYSADLRLREPMRVLLSTAGLYFPMAVVFSQGVYIHPYLFDVALAIPCILSTFCVLPAFLEGRAAMRGLPTSIACAAAIGYSFVQLRAYAVAFPIASGAT